jgi:hypothetical protein
MEDAVLEPVAGLPKGVAGLMALGTVVEHDVPQAVALVGGAGSATPGLAVFVARDFDGYLAELLRGLEKTAEDGDAPFARWALILRDDEIGEADLYGKSLAGGKLRVFRDSERQAALGWLAG